MKVELERRQFGRRTVRQHAWVLVSKRARLSCLVLNLSKQGAFLEFEPPKWLPHAFDLLLEDGSVVRGCEVRHYAKMGVGVNFVDPKVVETPEPVAATPIVNTGLWTGSDQTNLRNALASRRKR